MKKDDIMYGLENWENLESDLDSVKERIMENACRVVGEGFDDVADRIDWPVEVHAFKRMELGKYVAEHIAEDAITNALDSLDEEHADPGGDATEPTEAIKAAALAFGKAVVADYVSWACEPTGEVILYTRDEAKREEEGGAA